MHNSFISQLLLIFLSSAALGQQMGTNYKHLEEISRRNQLISDSLVGSFMIRPSSNHVSDSFQIQKSIYKHKDHFELFLLPIQERIIFNGAYPYRMWSEGNLTPSKGLQSAFSTGLKINLFDRVEAQMRPEYVYGQNTAYTIGLDDEHPRRYGFLALWQNRIDRPEQYGNKSFNQLLLSQSYIKTYYKSFSFGISNETLWWGPGKYTSLIMSDNAPGFTHLTLGTNRPVKTAIGKIEVQLIAGLLKNSGLPAGDTLLSYSGIPVYYNKPEENRYLSGLTFNYQPKWIPGLYLGYSKIIYQYLSAARSRQDYLPALTNHVRFSQQYNVRPVADRMTSYTMRWVMPKGNFEIYMELGRDSDWPTVQSFFRNPQINSAYLIGFSKLIPLKNEHFLEWNTELLKTQQPAMYARNNIDSWYIHDVVRHGYTNKGQLIGASVGPGSNLLLTNLSWIKNAKKLGLQFERITHNNDFNYRLFTESGNYNNFWIDHSLGIIGHWQINHLYFSWHALHTWSMNYQWGTIGANFQPFFENGYDRKNLLLKMELTYLF